MKQLLVICLTGPALLIPCAAAGPSAGKLPQVESGAIDEASGLAVSIRDASLLWAINDSGGSPELHLLGCNGEDRGAVRIDGATNRDWEDLASFSSDGVARLLVADTGDNQAKHDTSTLLILREPALPEAGRKLGGAVTPERRIEFRFEGGAVDCESVAVDAAGGRILLLGKRMDPPVLFELPLVPATPGLQTARRIGSCRVDSPAGTAMRFANQPTGLDISRDSRAAAVVTYYGVFVFRRASGQDWAEAFAGRPLALGPHGLPQAEAIAFSPEGGRLFVVSEGAHPLIRSFAVPSGR